MRITKTIIILAAVMLLAAGSAWAVTDAKTLTINATVSATAKLTLTPQTISFADADPDTTPSIPANSTVAVVAKVKTGSAAIPTLTCLAATDLTSGGDTIAISNVTWTASGGGFVAGTMNKTTGQSVASWTGSGNRSGTLTYSLANSWDYQTGSYAATVNYTLTAP